MTVNMYKTLDHLMAAPAVTGFEEPRSKNIIELFSKYCDTVTVDVIGNVIGTIGEGEHDVMLAGHYDQLGFMVRYIDDKGYASFVTVGGWDPRVAWGTRVKIWTGEHPEDFVVGTIGTKPAHLTDASEREKSVKIKDMRIDFGASSKDEALEMGVKAGAPVTAKSGLDRLGARDSDLVVGSAFDDVCAVASFIEMLDVMSGKSFENLKIHAVATVQEEIGYRGATVSAYNLQPWCAIAVDVTHAVAPGVEASLVGDINLGKGPAIAKGANFTRVLWELMENQATIKDIPYQVEGVPSQSGTDAWAMQVIRGGSISGLISIPSRYMHSPNEVISLTDLTNVGQLLAATLEGLEEKRIQHDVQVFKRNQL
jgi:endoglucanase